MDKGMGETDVRSRNDVRGVEESGVRIWMLLVYFN